MRRGFSAGKAVLAAILGFAAALPAATSYAEDHAADEAAIRKLELDLANVISPDGIENYYAADGAVVLDLIAPGYYVGRQQIHDAFAAQFATMSSVKVDIIDMNVLTDGEMACAFSLQHAAVGLKDGKSMDIAYMITDSLRKVGGRWYVLHQHIAYPMDPKTGMAVMNGPYAAREPIRWVGNPFPGPKLPIDQAKAEIRKMEESMIEAQTIGEAMKFYGPGEDASVYDIVYPGVYNGLKEIHDGFAPQMNFKSLASTIKDYGVETDGLFASAYSRQHIAITQKDGTSQEFDVRQSDCLHRVDGQWYSIHQQVSFPADPATGKSVTRLGPESHAAK